MIETPFSYLSEIEILVNKEYPLHDLADAVEVILKNHDLLKEYDWERFVRQIRGFNKINKMPTSNQTKTIQSWFNRLKQATRELVKNKFISTPTSNPLSAEISKPSLGSVEFWKALEFLIDQLDIRVLDSTINIFVLEFLAKIQPMVEIDPDFHIEPYSQVMEVLEKHKWKNGFTSPPDRLQLRADLKVLTHSSRSHLLEDSSRPPDKTFEPIAKEHLADEMDAEEKAYLEEVHLGITPSLELQTLKLPKNFTKLGEDSKGKEEDSKGKGEEKEKGKGEEKDDEEKEEVIGPKTDPMSVKFRRALNRLVSELNVEPTPNTVVNSFLEQRFSFDKSDVEHYEEVLAILRKYGWRDRTFVGVIDTTEICSQLLTLL